MIVIIAGAIILLFVMIALACCRISGRISNRRGE